MHLLLCPLELSPVSSSAPLAVAVMLGAVRGWSPDTAWPLPSFNRLSLALSLSRSLSIILPTSPVLLLVGASVVSGRTSLPVFPPVPRSHLPIGDFLGLSLLRPLLSALVKGPVQAIHEVGSEAVVAPCTKKRRAAEGPSLDA